ncbi:MAG: hypothetical protein WCI05_10195 [Myxococcales bacterium]|jgi:hypothetical protein
MGVGRFACLLVVAACACTQSSRLEGRWRGTRVEGVGRDVEAEALRFAGSMELEFRGDILTVSTTRERQSGRFRVVSNAPKSLVLVTDRDDPTEPQTFELVDDKTLRWSVLEGKTITFVRQ